VGVQYEQQFRSEKSAHDSSPLPRSLSYRFPSYQRDESSSGDENYFLPADKPAATQSRKSAPNVSEDVTRELLGFVRDQSERMERMERNMERLQLFCAEKTDGCGSARGGAQGGAAQGGARGGSQGGARGGSQSGQRLIASGGYQGSYQSGQRLIANGGSQSDQPLSLFCDHFITKMNDSQITDLVVKTTHSSILARVVLLVLLNCIPASSLRVQFQDELKEYKQIVRQLEDTDFDNLHGFFNSLEQIDPNFNFEVTETGRQKRILTLKVADLSDQNDDEGLLALMRYILNN
jgi:hypothetical protein